MYPLYISQFKYLGNYVRQSFVNLTHMGLDRFRIIEYSRLLDGTYIDLRSYIFTALKLGLYN